MREEHTITKQRMLLYKLCNTKTTYAVGCRLDRLEIGIEAAHILINHSKRLLECLLKLPADSHHLTHTLHGASDLKQEIVHNSQ